MQKQDFVAIYGKIAMFIRKRKSFLRILFSILSVLFICLIFSVYLINSSNRAIEEEVIASNMNYLRQSRSTFESRIEDIKKIMISLYFDPNVRYLQRLSPDQMRSNVGEIYLSKNVLAEYAYNNFFLDYYLYFKNSGRVVFQKALYQDAIFYSYRFNYTDMSFESWSELSGTLEQGMNILPLRGALYDNHPLEAVTFLYPLSSGLSDAGMIGVLVDQLAIKDIMGWSELDENSIALITNQRGEVIFRSGPLSDYSMDSLVNMIGSQDEGWHRSTVDGKNVIVFHLVSPDTGLKYMIVNRESTLLNNAKTAVSYSILGALAILCTAVAFLLSNQSLVPLRKLVAHLPEQINALNKNGEYWDEYDCLKNAIASLYNANQDLVTQLKSQSQHFQDAFLLKIISNSFSTGWECMKYMKLLEIDLSAGYCVMCVIKILSYDGTCPESEQDANDEVVSVNLKRAVLTAEFKDTDQMRQFQINISDNKIMMLLYVMEKTEEEAKRLIDDYLVAVVDCIKHAYQFDVLLGVGRICSSIYDLHSSYNDAHAIVIYEMPAELQKRIIYFHKKDPSDEIIYSNEKLENIVTSGNESDTGTALRQIYNDNFVLRQLSHSSKRLILYNMVLTLEQITKRLGSSSQVSVERIRTCIEMPSYSADEIFMMIKDAFVDVSRNVGLKKKQANNRFITKVYEYIDEHFLDPDIGLIMVSEHMNISVPYLCQIFKAENDATFFEYIEQKRMTHAKSLLAQNEYTAIGEIATKCGYNSATSFGRAFKRVNGVTPTEFRDSYQI